jgi:hypothetical protein
MNVPPPYPSEPQATANANIPNYLVWAIIITVVAFCLCCVVGAIPGVVAIVFATQVNSKLAQGDIAGAQRASANAKLWCWVTTGLAIFGLLLNIWSVMSGANEQWLEMMQQMQANQG